MSTMKASLSELGTKLVASHSQHCEAAAKSEASICGLNEKYGKASAEMAVLRSAVEAAALEQERSEEQMKLLQHDLDARTRDLQEVCLSYSCRASFSLVHSSPALPQRLCALQLLEKCTADSQYIRCSVPMLWAKLSRPNTVHQL